MSRVSKLSPSLFDLSIIWIIQFCCVIDTFVIVSLVSAATLSSSLPRGCACVSGLLVFAASLSNLEKGHGIDSRNGVRRRC